MLKVVIPFYRSIISNMQRVYRTYWLKYSQVVIPFYRSIISNDIIVKILYDKELHCWVVIPFYRSIISNKTIITIPSQPDTICVVIPFYRSIISNAKNK